MVHCSRCVQLRWINYQDTSWSLPQQRFTTRYSSLRARGMSQPYLTRSLWQLINVGCKEYKGTGGGIFGKVKKKQSN